MKITFICVLLIFLSACASTQPAPFKSELVSGPAYKENGLEYTKLPGRDLEIDYTVATASTDSIYLLVKVKNTSEKTLLIDPAMFTLKNDQNEKLAARDPATLRNSIERAAIISILPEGADLEVETPVSRDHKATLASAEESKDYISRNFLHKTNLEPGATAKGYILFYAQSPSGKWTLINKVSEKRLSSSKDQSWFEVSR